MKTKKQAATKKKAPLAKAKKASKPASKKLLRFASGKSNRAPAVIRFPVSPISSMRAATVVFAGIWRGSPLMLTVIT